MPPAYITDLSGWEVLAIVLIAAGIGYLIACWVERSETQ